MNNKIVKTGNDFKVIYKDKVKKIIKWIKTPTIKETKFY